jgi:hypothetical protein
MTNLRGGGGAETLREKLKKCLARPFPPCHWSSLELKKEKKN